MKKLLLILPILFLLMATNVEARSGCCSHHGGVCGCGCCDGSSLSNTCAPYYPECSRPVYIAPAPTAKPYVAPAVATAKPSTPKPTVAPTITPTETPASTPEVLSATTEAPQPTATPEVKVQGATTTNPVGTLIGLGAMGTVAYWAWRKKTLPKEV